LLEVLGPRDTEQLLTIFERAADRLKTSNRGSAKGEFS